MVDEKKIYREIKFAMAEKLMGKLKEIAISKGITEGLVAVRVSISSPPLYEIERVENPVNFIKKLAHEDGITQEKLNKAVALALPKD